MTGLILAEMYCLKDCSQISKDFSSTPTSFIEVGLCLSSSPTPITIVPSYALAKEEISFANLFLLLSDS